MKRASAIVRECRSWGFSDTGQVRTNNEDRIHYDDSTGIYFVVDGVGGEAAGEQAAEIAHRTLIENIDPEAPDLHDRIRVAIAVAGKKIYEAAARNPNWNGMACVLTVAVVRGLKAVIGHVGDSRLYKIRGTSIQKITRDHSPVGQMEDSGRINEAEAMAHPRRNEIFRDVGSSLRSPMEQDFIDISEIDFEQDAALLLCSDGLTDEVGSKDILAVVRRCAGDPQRVCRELIRLANQNGGHDNVSVVYVEQPIFAMGGRTPPETVTPIAETVESREAQGYGFLHIVVVAIVCSLLGAAAVWYFLRVRPDSPPGASATRVITVDAAAGPGDSSKIADAIQRAREGDVVELLPGVYSEHIQLKTGVWVVSRVPGGAELHPKIAADNTGPAVLANGVKETGLSGIRIIVASGQETAFGVLIENAEAVLNQVEIAGTSEAAIAIRGNSTVRLHAANLHDNAGAAVFANGPVKLELTNSALFRNGKSSSGRAAIELDAQVEPDLRGNVFGSNAGVVKSPDPKYVETEFFKWNVVLDREPARRGR
jgi:serine/threonine protein phosphatase PrpC